MASTVEPNPLSPWTNILLCLFAIIKWSNLLLKTYLSSQRLKSIISERLGTQFLYPMSIISLNLYFLIIVHGFTVKCKEVKKINYMSIPTTTEPNHGSVSTTHYTVEIKDAYLPPWITSSVCDAIRSNGNNTFEASFVMEPMSIGLNVGLDNVCHKSYSKHTKFEDLQEPSYPFGVKYTIVSHHLSYGFLKGLKYSDDSCTVSLLPV